MSVAPLVVAVSGVSVVAAAVSDIGVAAVVIANCWLLLLLSWLV